MKQVAVEKQVEILIWIKMSCNILLCLLLTAPTYRLSVQSQLTYLYLWISSACVNVHVWNCEKETKLEETFKLSSKLCSKTSIGREGKACIAIHTVHIRPKQWKVKAILSHSSDTDVCWEKKVSNHKLSADGCHSSLKYCGVLNHQPRHKSPAGRSSAGEGLLYSHTSSYF